MVKIEKSHVTLKELVKVHREKLSSQFFNLATMKFFEDTFDSFNIIRWFGEDYLVSNPKERKRFLTGTLSLFDTFRLYRIDEDYELKNESGELKSEIYHYLVEAIDNGEYVWESEKVEIERMILNG